MFEMIMAAIAYVVNIGVGFLSDGIWKTAGDSFVQFYCQLVCRREAAKLA